MKKTTTTPTPTAPHPFRAVMLKSIPLVAFQTPDPAATISSCRQACNGKSMPFLSWDSIRGLRPILMGVKDDATAEEKDMVNITNQRAANIANDIGDPIDTTNLPQCLGLLADKLDYSVTDDPDKTRLAIFMHSANRALESADVVQGVWNLRDPFKSTARVLVLLGPTVTLPPEIANDANVFDEPTPTEAEVDRMIDQLCDESKLALPDGTQRARIKETLTGYLSLFAIENSLCLAMTKDGFNLRALWDLKVSALRTTAGLEISQPTVTYADLAGCEGVKEFLLKVINGRRRPRGVFFLDEIEKMVAGSSGGDLSGTTQKQIEQFLYWTEERKVLAVLLVGVPGGGKSFTAKCTAGELAVPLLRGSISAAQSSLVGSSTQNMRMLLKTVDSVTAGETLMIATCNSLDNLTPEILSRFKLGVFVYDYPTRVENDALLALYRRKYKLPDEPFSAPDLWTGREIESLCDRAWLFKCSLAEAAKSVVPVSIANAARMETLRRSLNDRFLSAAEPGPYKYSERKAQPLQGRSRSLSL